MLTFILLFIIFVIYLRIKDKKEEKKIKEWQKKQEEVERLERQKKESTLTETKNKVSSSARLKSPRSRRLSRNYQDFLDLDLSLDNWGSTNNANSDKEKAINFLKSKGIYFFYHFTDRKNLQSIKKLGGLYSWNYLESNNLNYVNSGGNQESRSLDRRRNLQDYVRLSFSDNLPMKWHREQEGYDIVLLKISLSIINDDMLVSDINATDTNCNFSNGYKGLDIVDYQAVKKGICYRTDPLFKKKQAEILIKSKVPSEYIINLNSLV